VEALPAEQAPGRLRLAGDADDEPLA
jgi:hypothetical protein